MPIKILWGNDLNTCNNFIQELIEKKVSKDWQEINVSNFNGEEDNQVLRAFDESLTPPFGDGSRIIILKNNPIFSVKNEVLINKFQKIYQNIPNNTLLILQNIKKPDSRLKSTKFIQKLIKQNLVIEKSFSLPDIWDYEGQKRFIESAAKKMNLILDNGSAELIINSVGNDSYKLLNELEKAKIYLSSIENNNQKLILKSDDIKKIFNDHQSNIFKIIDYLLEKNIAKSLHEIYRLIQKGEPPLRLNAGLISQVRTHTIVKLIGYSGEHDLGQICKIANISNPKRIFFIKQKINNTSSYFLIKLMSKLLNIEFLLKKGNNPISVFTENLVNLV